MQLKITVIATGGKTIGEAIKRESLQRGHVTSWFLSDPDDKSNAEENFAKIIMDLTYDRFTLEHAIVDAFGFWSPLAPFFHTEVLDHLCNICSSRDIRLIVVGGAGSLYVDKEHTKQILYTPNFPNDIRSREIIMAKELAALRKRNDVNWTYVSTAVDFQIEGERTSKYILGGEKFQVNAQGESTINYADYAKAIIDEIEADKHIKRRISVLSK